MSKVRKRVGIQSNPSINEFLSIIRCSVIKQSQENFSEHISECMLDFISERYEKYKSIYDNKKFSQGEACVNQTIFFNALKRITSPAKLWHVIDGLTMLENKNLEDKKLLLSLSKQDLEKIMCSMKLIVNQQEELPSGFSRETISKYENAAIYHKNCDDYISHAITPVFYADYEKLSVLSEALTDYLRDFLFESQTDDIEDIINNTVYSCKKGLKTYSLIAKCLSKVLGVFYSIYSEPDELTEHFDNLFNGLIGDGPDVDIEDEERTAILEHLRKDFDFCIKNGYITNLMQGTFDNMIIYRIASEIAHLGKKKSPAEREIYEEFSSYVAHQYKNNVYISPNSQIEAPCFIKGTHIQIGDGVYISKDSFIASGEKFYDDRSSNSQRFKIRIVGKVFLLLGIKIEGAFCMERIVG